MRTRLLLVDDHPVVREGLRSMLGDSAVDVVAEAGTAADAVRLTRETAPDVVLLDMTLPDLDGLSALARIRQARPETAVLVLTMRDDPALVRGAVREGAAGYLLKGVGRQELLAAVLAVRHGESVIDPTLLRALSEPAAEPLTPVERDVLQLIAAGLTNRQIAERLRWSVGTAKKYVQRVLAKLEVTDRTQAAVVALRRGLLPAQR
ncbi:MAG TPA: response regulator transcription factor [Candidatus Binatia bacterium]|nr:response regulator transcription factor [Candidatus Binatia bacterium]